MTILNVHIERDRALIAANTELVWPDGQKYGNTPKLFALPHADAVFAFAGPISVGHSIYFDCCASRKNLDELFEVLESHFKTRCAEFEKQAADAGVAVVMNAMCVLVGWSRRWNQVVGVRCSRFETYSRSIAESFVSPGDDSWPARPYESPSNDAEMITTARYQAQQAELAWPGHAWGGDLNIAEVTRDAITFRNVREFWK